MDLFATSTLDPEKRREILSRAHSYVTNVFEGISNETFGYHNWAHTVEVTERALLLARRSGLDEQVQWELSIAGLFHDIGYYKDYLNHEAASATACKAFLSNENLPEDIEDRIIDLILVTKPGAEPVYLPEKIMKDADLANVGSTQYFQNAAYLRQEWEKYKGETYSDEEWLILNGRFLKEHHFYTSEAEQIYGEQKKANIKEMKKKISKLQAKRLDLEGDLQKAVKDSRSAQLIFKTSLRNQIDLTNIADNKANIMLSINAIIITITLPLLAAYVQDNVYMLIPASVLLTTCVVSIIFATLVTRPIKMSGLTDINTIREGKTNLFFFGNFYKMNYEDYVRGLRIVISRDEYVDQSIFKDLYNLGRTLGTKYKQLRVCYTIFMSGVVMSVLAFGITYMLKLI